MNVLRPVIVIVLGAGIAAAKDLTFDMESYVFIFFANLFSSLYAVFINVTKKETGLDVFGMLYYNYLVLLPLVIILGVVTGDFEASLNFPHLYDFSFQIAFQASVFLAFLLNLAAFYCTILNSATTKTVTGCLKNFFTMVLGLYLFDDYIYHPMNFLGLCIAFVGGVWYSVETYTSKPAPISASGAPTKGHSSNTSAEMVGIGTPNLLTPMPKEVEASNTKSVVDGSETPPLSNAFARKNRGDGKESAPESSPSASAPRDGFKEKTTAHYKV